MTDTRQQSQWGIVERTRGVCAGQTRFAGTRIAVDLVVNLIKSGASDEQIRDEFPTLQQPDVDVARELSYLVPDASSELDRIRLEKARLQAKCAVLMQATAWMARNGHQERAAAWIKAADDAAKNVRLEDLVVAHVNHPEIPDSSNL